MWCRYKLLLKLIYLSSGAVNFIQGIIQLNNLRRYGPPETQDQMISRVIKEVNWITQYFSIRLSISWVNFFAIWMPGAFLSNKKYKFRHFLNTLTTSYMPNGMVKKINLICSRLCWEILRTILRMRQVTLSGVWRSDTI